MTTASTLDILSCISCGHRQRSTPPGLCTYPVSLIGVTCSVTLTDYSGDRGPCGWKVSPRASISTNCSMHLARVSIFFALPIR